ncbi:uncharacterized protein DNG_09573 [Cephalotrichum gorgonifer]|uniref:Uncharacterized protein n=1 Tax=Cephalotrichum gorgonifer TaxID=2041049 RepID=A0AAE8N744_9PEZI|nr:uncharacterized protein DNG_09573 [Cephalotrichum gorgonifer]
MESASGDETDVEDEGRNDEGVHSGDEEERENIYTQVNNLFAETSGERSTETRRTAWLEKEKGRAPRTAPSPPLSSPFGRPPMQQALPSHFRIPEGMSQPQPRPVLPGGSRRPEVLRPQGTQAKRRVDDSEIMRHLVGGIATLTIPMSQDESGRWRIQNRRV